MRTQGHHHHRSCLSARNPPTKPKMIPGMRSASRTIANNSGLSLIAACKVNAMLAKASPTVAIKIPVRRTLSAVFRGNALTRWTPSYLPNNRGASDSPRQVLRGAGWFPPAIPAQLLTDNPLACSVQGNRTQPFHGADRQSHSIKRPKSDSSFSR